MKKFFFSFLLSLVSSFSFAQLNGDGFYRVQNAGTGDYCVLTDASGGMLNSTTPDLSALKLFFTSNHDIPSECGSVIYVKKISGNQYDLIGQGTSIYSFAGIYANISGNATTNKYKVTASKSGATLTLYASTKKSFGYRTVTTSGSGDNGFWKALPVSSTGDNYLGVSPTIESNGKYYQPFYMQFPFKFVSTGMKAYYVTKVVDDVAIIKEITSSIIPGATPVIIECSSKNTSDNRIELLYNQGTAVTDNVLSGNYFCDDFISLKQFGGRSETAAIAFDAKSMRVWNVNASGKLCLSTDTKNLHEWYFTEDYDPDEPEDLYMATNRFLNKNSSYLKVEANTASELKIMTEDEYKASQNVHVTALALDKTSATLNLTNNKTITLKATVTPDNATNKTVTWTSSNPSVATVDGNGIVTAVSLGETTITVVSNDNNKATATCKITVEPTLVSSLTLNATSAELTVGDTQLLVASITPKDATDKTVTWSSSDPKIASVDNDGLVKAIAKGSAVITVKANDASNLTASCTVVVNPKMFTVTAESSDATLGTVEGGGVYEDGTVVTLTAVPSENAKFVSWSDGSNKNPYQITVTSDLTITALFEIVDGIAEINSTSTDCCRIYNVNGIRLNKLQRGINIVNGKKIIVK